ncbi:NAD(P)H-hydrate epimerase [Bordetella genomosp. 13]|nr:NAD(P)H-hydrate epimerase [Bordetella genomosp. 13]
MELPVDRIRRIERDALARGVPLMPRAGLAAAHFAAAKLGAAGMRPMGAAPGMAASVAPTSAADTPTRPVGDVAAGTVLALAGSGNNGGDAMVAATWLRRWGYRVQVVLFGDPDRLPSDARQALDGWRDASGPLLSDLPADPPAMVLDGLFGIGLNRPLDAAWQSRIDAVNAWGIPVLALDVPSGLDAAAGRPLGRPIWATWTLSFIASAPGLRQGVGPQVSGECHLDELGLNVADPASPSHAPTHAPATAPAPTPPDAASGDDAQAP